MVATTDKQRPAREGERCSCGRPAKVVQLLSTGREVPWCGLTLSNINRLRVLRELAQSAVAS